MASASSVNRRHAHPPFRLFSGLLFFVFLFFALAVCLASLPQPGVRIRIRFRSPGRRLAAATQPVQSLQTSTSTSTSSSTSTSTSLLSASNIHGHSDTSPTTSTTSSLTTTTTLTNSKPQTTTTTTQFPFAPSSIRHECVIVKPVDWIVESFHVGKPASYYFNERSFCITPPVCVSVSSSGDAVGTIRELYEPDDHKLSCRRSSTSLTDEYPAHGRSSEVPLDCAELKRRVYCANGWYVDTNVDARLKCPTVLSGASASASASTAGEKPNVEHELMVVIPSYNNLNNIYHYAHVLASVTHVLSALRVLIPEHAPNWSAPKRDDGGVKVALLFKGHSPKGYGHWQHQLTSLIIDQRFRALGLDVSTHTFFEDRNNEWIVAKADIDDPVEADEDDGPAGIGDRTSTTTGTKIASSSSPGTVRTLDTTPAEQLCARRAVWMGARDSRAWPYANYRSFSGVYKQASAGSVPAEAVMTKAAVYRGLGLDTVLPTAQLLSSDLRSLPARVLMDLPPLGVAYARRNGQADPLPGEYVRRRARRFSDADEAWFVSTLSQTADKYKASFATVQIFKNVTFAEQVRLYKQAGYIAGIHGANFVNAVFMHSFGGLMEVANDDTFCYFLGANSGLSYWHHVPQHIATVAESACAPDNVKCLASARNRRVMIDTPGDRARIAQLIDDGVRNVVDLHRRFGHLSGIPTVLNSTALQYDIDWSQARAV